MDAAELKDHDERMARGERERAERTAVREWFRLYYAYHKASDTYNARVEYLRAERERTNWSVVGNADHEYRVLNDAQRAAIAGAETLYQTLLGLGCPVPSQHSPGSAD